MSAFDDEVPGTGSPLLLPIDVQAVGDQLVVVSVHGEVDLSEAGELRAVLNDACTGPHAVIQLDLGDVHFMGSTGIGVLVEVHQRLAGEGRRLEVLHTSLTIRSAFEIAGVDFVLGG